MASAAIIEDRQMDLFSSFAVMVKDMVERVSEPVRVITSSRDSTIIRKIANHIETVGSIRISGDQGDTLAAFKSREDAYEATCILEEAGVNCFQDASTIADIVRDRCTPFQIHLIHDSIGGRA